MPKRLTPLGEAAPPVEPIVTGATLPPKPSTAKSRAPRAKAGARYIRNVHHIQARVTLNSGRRIELQPRGQRGDMDILNAEEQQDPKFLANRGVLFEVLDVPEAEAIISKQQINSRQQQPSVWDHLRSETNKPYEQRHARIEEAFEKQGVVIGSVAEPAPDGSTASHNLGFVRAPGAAPEVVSVPGSPGDPATTHMQSVPSGVEPEEYHEFLLWKQFRAERAAQRAQEAKLPTNKENT